MSLSGTALAPLVCCLPVNDRVRTANVELRAYSRFSPRTSAKLAFSLNSSFAEEKLGTEACKQGPVMKEYNNTTTVRLPQTMYAMGMPNELGRRECACEAKRYGASSCYPGHFKWSPLNMDVAPRQTRCSQRD